MRFHRTCLATVAFLGLVSAGTPAFTQNTPPGLRDLVGARAGQAEGELGRRGYIAVRTETGDDRKWTFWYNKTYGRCVTIATVNGRYDSIVETPVADCRPRSGAGATPARPGWPASLQPFGSGYPVTASPCRRLRETSATVNYLDDSATLVGCPLGRRHWRVRALLGQGGRIVGQEANVLLISVPRRR